MENKLEQLYGRALDNELADGLSSEEARANVVARAAAYTDDHDVDVDAFRAYAQTQLPFHLRMSDALGVDVASAR